MERNIKNSACEKCAVQSKIIQKYSEDILDLQRQVSVLSSRLLKYEPDPPVEELCVVKMENNSDDDFISDDKSVQNADDDNDSKDIAVNYFSESSRDDFPDIEYEVAEVNADENRDSPEWDPNDKVRTKQDPSSRKRKCKTCDEEFSSSRGLLRHNHEVHGKRRIAL